MREHSIIEGVVLCRLCFVFVIFSGQLKSWMNIAFLFWNILFFSKTQNDE